MGDAPPMSKLLSVDIGTSSVKALLFDPEKNSVLAAASREYPLYQPQPGYAEQNPEDWWQATLHTIREVTQQNKDVASIGLTGQMHGTVLLDQHSQVVHPAIIWADQRSGESVQVLLNAVGESVYVQTAGTLPAAGFMGSTLVWLKQHEPALLDKVSAVLLPKDYVRLKLTGEIASEVTDAASSGLFDVKNQCWSDLIVSAAGLPDSILPPVLASGDVAGSLREEAAQLLGLKAGIPVVAGCADQPAQAIANGLIHPGRVSVTIGTGGQVFAPVRLHDDGSLPTDRRLHVFNHAAPDTWYILGAMLSAGLSLRWLREVLGLGGQPDAYALLSQEAAQVPAGAEGLIFLPYLVGERTPHLDPQARGAFIGLGFHHTRGHMARAVMEGVTFALRQGLEITIGLCGAVDLVIGAGGGAESALWRQIQADVYGLPLQRAALPDQTNIGAVMLAGVGCGIYADVEDACQHVTQYAEMTEPAINTHAFYTERYEQFLTLYPRLKDDFHQLAARR